MKACLFHLLSLFAIKFKIKKRMGDDVTRSEDPQQPAVTGVEVVGFLYWITSAVFYGTFTCVSVRFCLCV